MEPAVGAWCTGSEVCFRLQDQEHRLLGVRLMCGVVPGRPPFTYDESTRTWELRVPRPPVQRLEYKFDLAFHGGGGEYVLDPDNPRRVPGGYGDSSEVLCPGYTEPGWLHLPQAPGTWRDVYLPLPALKSEMVAHVWSPATPTPHVVIAHDGPDYAKFADLTRYAATMIGAGRVRPFHLVLLPPGERFEWYSANPAYARALALDALPKLTAELGTSEPDPAGSIVGVGASLGGLAMLHAQQRHPAWFAGLFLQSGSFFQPRFDRQESGFERWLRIVRFTGRVRRRDTGPGVPVVVTCGAAEENLANNQDMAAVLAGQGYDVSFTENPDGHTWVGWRDTLDPGLTGLLQKLF